MEIPYFKQETEHTCGAASMRMVLAGIGIKKSEKEIAQRMRSSPGTGTFNKQFPLFAEELKLAYQVKKDSSIEELKQLLKEGFAVIVTFFDTIEKVGHYAVVKSVDASKIHFLDPWHGPNHSLSIVEFMKVWKNSMEPDKRWLIGIKNQS